MDGIMKEGSLGSILFKSQIITEADIQAALAEQKATGCRFGEALVKLGVVAQEDIDWALSNQLNIPYVRLKLDMVDRGATELVPAALARKHNLIPLIRAGDELNIAIADPLNQAGIEAVEQVTGCTVSISVALIREIREMLDTFYGAELAENSMEFVSPCFPPTVLASINGDTSGGTLLNYLFLAIIQQNLASLSLRPVGETVLVSGKKGGVTSEIGRLPLDRYSDFLLNVRKLSKINGSCELSSRGSIGFMSRGAKASFQVAILRGAGGDYVTFRKEITASFPAQADDLGISQEKTRQLAELARTSRGMVVIASQDPQVRSRFMELFLQSCETARKNVLLIGAHLGKEDGRFPRIPVSCQGEGELKKIVSAALDHDPDILAIEDVTESSSFIAAFRAAMLGKFVIAGISVSDTAGTFNHLLSLWRKSYFMPAYLKGIITLKGVLSLCPECRESYEPAPEELAGMGLSATAGGYCRAKGCPACDHSGYQGRKYLVDVIPVEETLLRRFEGARDGDELVTFLKHKGYRGILEEGREMVTAGQISPEEFVASVLL